MAGLYDDLPEPSSSSSAPAVITIGVESCTKTSPSLQIPRVRQHVGLSSSGLLRLDEVSLSAILAFLALPELGRSIAPCCKALRWARDEWLPWRRFFEPLHRQRVHISSLQHIHERSVEALEPLAQSIEELLRNGFQGTPGNRRRRPLGCWGVPMPAATGSVGGCGSSSSSMAAVPVPGQSCYYGELPMPRVVWSLHTEGFTHWRGVCSIALDGYFSLLPPWNKRKSALTTKVKLIAGISLWLPPEGAAASVSFPALYLSIALADTAAIESLAMQHPDNPPCLAATMDAILFRPSKKAVDVAVLEEWSLRFCFGPEEYRHPGHGETDGYRLEVKSEGRRKWRPPDLCYTKAGEEPQDTGLHLLVGGRRCDGLLD